MMLLAIDPGPVQSGVAWWNGIEARGEILPNHSALALIWDIAQPADIVAFEQFVPMGQRVDDNSIKTCEFTGVLKHTLRQFGHSLLPISRREVKQHVLGRVTGTDADVRAALIARFGPPGTKSAPGTLHGITGHMMAAFAVAVTAYDQAVGRDLWCAKKEAEGIKPWRAEEWAKGKTW